jgi:uncharacterized membrane protein
MAVNDKEVKPDIENDLSKVEQELIRTNPQIFQGVPKDKRQEIVRAFVSVTKIHSGPLPPSEMLQGYEAIHPGSAKIIFDIFANQSAHRIKMEDTVVTSQQIQSARGQTYAFIIAILFLAVSALCILKGHDVAGGVLGTIDVLGLVTIFITGKLQQTSNLQQKNPQKGVLPNKKR